MPESRGIPGLLPTSWHSGTHYCSSWFPGHVMYGIEAATGSMALMKASPTRALSWETQKESLSGGAV